MLIRREKEPSRRVWFSFIFIGFLFWLRADGGLALFLLLLFCFSLPGAIIFLKCQTACEAWPAWLLFSLTTPRSPFFCLFVFVRCCVCLYVYFLVALHLYIWGNIVLNTCMAFVVIKIVSLVSLFVLFLIVNVIFKEALAALFPLVRHYNSWYNTQYREGNRKQLLMLSYVCMCKCVFVCLLLLSPLRLFGKPINPPGANIGKTAFQAKVLFHQFKVAAIYNK